jgi:hypothetical protein
MENGTVPCKSYTDNSLDLLIQAPLRMALKNDRVRQYIWIIALVLVLLIPDG